MNFRNLSEKEINQLEKNSCFCDNWSLIEVRDGFSTQNIRNVTFSGTVSIGLLQKSFIMPGGVPKKAGIYNANIHNCRIGDNVYINQVKNYLANYDIGDNVIIENVDTLSVTEQSGFGNGVKIAVLNETGGREIAMYNNLSAHTAYLMAFYRHRPQLINNLMGMVDVYVEKIKSNMGKVEFGAHLVNCRTLLNINIGAYAKVEGVYRLTNGSVNSCKEDPAYVGPGVIAEDFITSCGSIVTDSTMISKCFVGEGTILSKQYSAENSVFFANCQGFHGEACSIFAGPYTVSHHKSTLLIAGYYSFLNAGSGSNQSNHLYKLGPIHQGVVERGGKTTSDSYLLWPAKIGAFSLVMGRHYRNPDTSDLPFSYLIENKDESYLAPAVNLRSIGTIRDARKWPKRDRRKSPELLDSIVFNLLSPYSIQKMIHGIKVLKDLKASCVSSHGCYIHNSVVIEEKSVDRGIYLYRLGLVKFLGNGLVKKLELKSYKTDKEMRKALASEGKEGCGDWIDMAGLLVPKEIVLKFVNEIEQGNIDNIDTLNGYYRKWKDNYFLWAWNWIVPRLKEEIGLDINVASRDQIDAFVEEWKNAVVALDEMMYKDARKEFTLKSQTGFGIDGSADTRATDFENVRGEFNTHPAVMDLLEHINKKSKLASKVRERLATLVVESVN